MEIARFRTVKKRTNFVKDRNRVADNVVLILSPLHASLRERVSWKGGWKGGWKRDRGMEYGACLK